MARITRSDDNEDETQDVAELLQELDAEEQLSADEAARDDAREALEALEAMGVSVAPDDEDAKESQGFTLEELDDLVYHLSRIKRLNGTDPLIKGQWSKVGGNYTMVGDVTGKLPPGYYATVVDNAGTLFFVPTRARTDKLLRFPHAQVDKVMQTVEMFWDREERFKEFNLPFKRGILMYGPPGSGKTSALQLVARDVVHRGGIVLEFEPAVFMAAYRQVRRVQPDIPMVVMMEDLDAILESHRESTVLNILDGAESIHRTVFVATTNYPRNLGPRIINRPSRFDKRIFVGHPDVVGRTMYLESLIEGHDVKVDIKKYVKDTDGMSLAHLKELFVATVIIGEPYPEALEHLKIMNLKTPTDSDDDDMGWVEDTQAAYL